MKSTGLVVLLVLLIVLATGAVFADEKEMTESDFIEIYVQLSITAEKFLDYPDTLQAKQDSIFEKSGFTRDDFNKFREKIDKEPEKWNDIWKKIVDRISAISRGDEGEEAVENPKK